MADESVLRFEFSEGGPANAVIPSSAGPALPADATRALSALPSFLSRNIFNVRVVDGGPASPRNQPAAPSIPMERGPSGVWSVPQSGIQQTAAQSIQDTIRTITGRIEHTFERVFGRLATSFVAGMARTAAAPVVSAFGQAAPTMAGAASGGSGLGLGGVALTGFSVGVASAAVAVAGLTTAAIVAGRAILSLGQEVGRFSPMIAGAQASVRVRMMEAQIQAAGRIGPEASQLINVQGRIEIALLDLKTSVLKTIAPAVVAAGEALASVVETTAAGLTVLQEIPVILEAIAQWNMGGITAAIQRIATALAPKQQGGGVFRLFQDFMHQQLPNLGAAGDAAAPLPARRPRRRP